MDFTALARRVLRNELQQWMQRQLRSQTSELGGDCSRNFSSAQTSLGVWASRSLGSAGSFPQAGWEPPRCWGAQQGRDCPGPCTASPAQGGSPGTAGWDHSPLQEERLGAQGGPGWELQTPQGGCSLEGLQGAGGDPGQALRGHPVPVSAGCRWEETWAGLSPLTPLDKPLPSPGPLAVEPSLGIRGRLIPVHLLRITARAGFSLRSLQGEPCARAVPATPLAASLEGHRPVTAPDCSSVTQLHLPNPEQTPGVVPSSVGWAGAGSGLCQRWVPTPGFATGTVIVSPKLSRESAEVTIVPLFQLAELEHLPVTL